MKIWEKEVNSTLKYVEVQSTAESLAWTLLRNPSSLRIIYDDIDKQNFARVVELLRESKDQIERGNESSFGQI
jgi:hypothetical protein